MFAVSFFTFFADILNGFFLLTIQKINALINIVHRINGNALYTVYGKPFYHCNVIRVMVTDVSSASKTEVRPKLEINAMEYYAV